MIREDDLQAKDAAIVPRLDEPQGRMIAAAEAVCLGHGGVSRGARASGLSRTTIHRGLAALEQSREPGRRTRHVGGGRKGVVDRDPTLLQALEALGEPLTRGGSPVALTVDLYEYTAAGCCAQTAGLHPQSSHGGPSAAGLG